MSENKDKARAIGELEEKRAQLIEVNKEIEQLKKAIAIARRQEEQQRLVEASPNRNIGLPDTALKLVFEHFIAENSAGIRSLFLICQGWKKLLEETPAFWCHIRLTIPAEAKHINIYAKYCEACIKYSGELPLDIWLDYRPASLPLDLAIFEHLLPPLQKMNEDPNFQKDLEKWLWRRCRSNPEPIAPEYKKHYLKPVEALIGAEGANMKRWRKFELYCKQTKTGVFQWSSFIYLLVHPLPILETLVIHNENPREVVVIDDLHTPLPHIPQIQELRLTNGHFSPNLREVDKSKLRILHLPWFSNVDTFQFALQCPHLTELSIRVDPRSSSKEDVIASVGFQKGMYSFQDLKVLRIGGNIPSEFWTTIELPALQTLFFGDHIPLLSLALPGTWSLPLVETISLDCRKVPEEGLTENIFQTLIANCSSLQTIEVPERHEKEVVVILQALKQRNVASSTLQRLGFAPKVNQKASRYVDVATL